MAGMWQGQDLNLLLLTPNPLFSATCSLAPGTGLGLAWALWNICFSLLAHIGSSRLGLGQQCGVKKGDSPPPPWLGRKDLCAGDGRRGSQ